MSERDPRVEGIEDCPECDGKGFTVVQVCCGNLTRTGECRGYCSVPEQQKCLTCADERGAEVVAAAGTEGA